MSGLTALKFSIPYSIPFLWGTFTEKFSAGAVTPIGYITSFWGVICIGNFLSELSSNEDFRSRTAWELVCSLGLSSSPPMLKSLPLSSMTSSTFSVTLFFFLLIIVVFFVDLLLDLSVLSDGSTEITCYWSGKRGEVPWVCGFIKTTFVWYDSETGVWPPWAPPSTEEFIELLTLEERFLITFL